jgi:hypothetical protein
MSADTIGLCNDDRVASARSSAEVRRLLLAARIGARRTTATRRALPDFVILGAQRAGTTSLYNYLSRHPSVLPAARKEVHYFDVNYSRGEEWYRAMFPRQRAMLARAGRPRLLTGEASPYYLFHPLAPERAARLVPQARLIVLLRDPVERAWSHYRHEVTAGRESLSFTAALDAEEQRLSGAAAAIRDDIGGELAANHRYFSYVARGRYAEQIRTWLTHFPRESFVFLDSAVLFANPRETWQLTASFLGIDPEPAPSFTVHNAGGDVPLPAWERARLRDVFTASDRDLENVVGRSFSWMSNG